MGGSPVAVFTDVETVVGAEYFTFTCNYRGKTVRLRYQRLSPETDRMTNLYESEVRLIGSEAEIVATWPLFRDIVRERHRMHTSGGEAGPLWQ